MWVLLLQLPMCCRHLLNIAMSMSNPSFPTRPICTATEERCPPQHSMKSQHEFHQRQLVLMYVLDPWRNATAFIESIPAVAELVTSGVPARASLPGTPDGRIHIEVVSFPAVLMIYFTTSRYVVLVVKFVAPYVAVLVLLRPKFTLPLTILPQNPGSEQCE